MQSSDEMKIVLSQLLNHDISTVHDKEGMALKTQVEMKEL